MAGEGKYRSGEALQLAGVSRRELALWENTRKLFKINRNPGSKNGDRAFTRDDIELLKWVKEKFKEGLSSDAIKILIEYYETGKVVSVRWHK